LAVGVVVAFVGLGDVARAASPDDPAKVALDEASRAEASGHLTEAIDALKLAYEVSGDTELLFRLGELTRKIGQDVSAMRFYRAYLTRDPRGKHRAAAERQVHLLEAAAGDPDAPLPSAARTPPAPTGAPPSPAPSQGEGRTNPAPGPGNAAPVSLTLETPPVATAQTSPPVDLQANAAPAADGVQPPLPRWLPWVGVAATVALGTGATLSGLAASHHYDDLRSSCGATAAGCSSAQIDDVRSRARTTNLLWAGAGVLAAATGVAVYVNTREAGFSGIWRF
jgi:hypothetical protein